MMSMPLESLCGKETCERDKINIGGGEDCHTNRNRSFGQGLFLTALGCGSTFCTNTCGPCSADECEYMPMLLSAF